MWWFSEDPLPLPLSPCHLKQVYEYAQGHENARAGSASCQLQHWSVGLVPCLGNTVVLTQWVGLELRSFPEVMGVGELVLYLWSITWW